VLTLGCGWFAQAQQEVNGTRRDAADHWVIHVWGTHEEMGYAHGYLMAEEVMALANGYVLPMFGVDAGTYEMLKSAFGGMLDYPDPIREEAEAILEGVAAAGVSLEMTELGRDIDADDLLLANSAADLFGVYFGCSSISAWGAATADDGELAGELAMVRDLDWGYRGDVDLRDFATVIARDPDDGQPWVSIGFPSYVGCLSCFNHSGIGAFQNQGNTMTMLGDIDGEDTLVPIHMSMRTGIESQDYNGDSANTIDDVIDSVGDVGRIGSYEVHLISPANRSDPPAAILEVDYSGHVVRYPEDEPLAGPDCVAVTNHHRLLIEPAYCDRFETMQQMVEEYEGALTLDRLWEIETEVAWNSPGSGTIHTMRVVPIDLTLEVAFSDADNVAPLNPITAYTMDDLFEGDLEPIVVIDDDDDDGGGRAGCGCSASSARPAGALVAGLMLLLGVRSRFSAHRR